MTDDDRDELADGPRRKTARSRGGATALPPATPAATQGRSLGVAAAPGGEQPRQPQRPSIRRAATARPPPRWPVVPLVTPEHHSGDLGARTPPRLGLNVGARTHGRLGLRWLADHPRFFSEPGTRDHKGREGPP